MSAMAAETTLNLPACPEIGNRAVAAIHAAYDGYHGGFEEITQRARARFERRDWAGARADATERLALYRTYVDAAVADVHDILQDAVMERTLWAAMRARHAAGLRHRPDVELAQTFFNSVTRRVFSTAWTRGPRLPTRARTRCSTRTGWIPWTRPRCGGCSSASRGPCRTLRSSGTPRGSPG
jgi:isocitrate dehydrogenase kinase/phosphatase